jgi:hypothetical protein
MSKPYNGFSGIERDQVWKLQKANVEILQWAVKPCDVCGQHSTAIMPHLENYFIWSKYHPMCVECHMAIHSRFSFPAKWLTLLHNINNGMLPYVWPSVGAFFAKQSQYKVNKELKTMPSPSEWKGEHQWFLNIPMTLSESEGLRDVYFNEFSRENGVFPDIATWVKQLTNGKKAK